MTYCNKSKIELYCNDVECKKCRAEKLKEANEAFGFEPAVTQKDAAPWAKYIPKNYTAKPDFSKNIYGSEDNDCLVYINTLGPVLVKYLKKAERMGAVRFFHEKNDWIMVSIPAYINWKAWVKEQSNENYLKRVEKNDKVENNEQELQDLPF